MNVPKDLQSVARALARMDECRAGCDAGDPFYADAAAWDTIRAHIAAAPSPTPGVFPLEIVSDPTLPEGVVSARIGGREVGRIEPTSPVEASGREVWLAGLLDRIESAMKRIEDGHGLRRIPADPTDVDLVLAECRDYITGKAPPFWLATPTAEPNKENDRG
jgi:hypothetical protein